MWSLRQFSDTCDDTSIVSRQSLISPTETTFGNKNLPEKYGFVRPVIDVFSNLDVTAYLDERDNELGDTIEAQVLAQPQFRWDAGKAWFEAPQQLFVGIEYQYWQNKLGDKDTDESAAQLLAVWRF